MSFEVKMEVNGREVDALNTLIEAAKTGRPNLAMEALTHIVPAIIEALEALTPQEEATSKVETPTPTKRTAKASVKTDDGTEEDVHS